MAARRLAFVLLSVLCGQAAAAQAAASKAAKEAAADPTPMSKVVELLAVLKMQLEKDAEKDVSMFNKYNEWFEKEIMETLMTIMAVNQTIDEVQAMIQEEEAKREAFQMDLQKSVAEEAQATKDLADATHVREEEHKAFLQTEAQLLVAIDQFARSIEVLHKEAPPADATVLLDSGSAGSSAAHSKKGKLLEVARQLRETMEHSRDFSLTESQRESLDELFRIAAARSHEGSTTAAPKQDAGDSASDAAPAFLQVRAKAKVQAKANAKAKADGNELDPFGEYETQTGGLIDTLGVVHQKTEEELEKARADEQEAREVFSHLKVILDTFIEEKGGVIANLKVQISESEQKTGKAKSQVLAEKENLESASKELMTLDSEHKVKIANFQERMQKRGDEELAVKEALEILTSSTAQRLIEAQFSADATPESEAPAAPAASQEQPEQEDSEAAPSFVQIQMASPSQPAQEAQEVQRVLSFLATAARVGAQHRAGRYGLLRGDETTDPFGKVKNLIRNMLHKLTEAQAAETKQAAWCDSEMAKSTKELRSRKRDVQKIEDRIEEMGARETELKDEIAQATKQMEESDEAAEEAVELRMRESERVSEALVQYREAQRILRNALEVMRKFYENKEREGDSSFKASGAGSGVIGLLEVALSDYVSLEQELSLNEKVAQQDFDEFMQQHRIRVKVLQKDLDYKKGQLVKLDGEKMRSTNDNKSYQKELDAVTEYLKELKATCTVKGDSYDERKARREKELAALKSALEFIRADSAV